MAKKQSRRTISLNRNTYEAVKQEAAQRGVTLAALVESALSAIGVPVVAHPQQTTELVRASAARRAESMTSRREGAGPIRLPSLERQLLGDQVADAYGFQ